MNVLRTLLRRRDVWTSFLALLLGAIWIIASAVDPGEATAGIPAPQEGFFAPDFTLAALDDQTYSLAELRGRPVIINLWASWCAPCRAEMPAIERVHRAYQDQGLVVLAVNATNQDSIASARAFGTQYGLTFPLLLDEDGAVSRLYQLRALPSTYFVGRDGVIQDIVIGGPMSEALLRSRVERLLEGP